MKSFGSPVPGSSLGVAPLLADAAFVGFLVLFLTSADGFLTYFTFQSYHRWYWVSAVLLVLCQLPCGLSLYSFSMSSPAGVCSVMQAVHVVLIVVTTAANGLTTDDWAYRAVLETVLACVLTLVSVSSASAFVLRRGAVSLLLWLTRVLGLLNVLAVASPWLNHRFGFATVTSRLQTVTFNPNTTGGFAAFAASSAVVLLLHRSPLHHYAGVEVSLHLALAVSVAVLSGSRGALAALFGLFVLLLAWVFLFSRSRWRFGFAVFSLVLAAIIIGTVYRLLAPGAQTVLLRRWTWFFLFGSGGGADPMLGRALSTRQRLSLARYTLDVGLRARGLGAGGGTARYMTGYGWTDNGWPLSSHNTYLEMFAEQGLLGVLALLWFHGALVRNAARSSLRPLPLFVAGQLAVWWMVFGTGTTVPAGLPVLLSVFAVLAEGPRGSSPLRIRRA